MIAEYDVHTVSPALEKYTQNALMGDVWKRPGLSVRDRSLITAAVLIARSQPIGMPHIFGFALDNGLSPAELSEVVTHLAFYSGWANAMSAVIVLKDIFLERGVGPAQLSAASPDLLPLDQAAEDARATIVAQTVGPVSEGVVKYTRELLFRDLWLRPVLAPRDRSFITVTALIATGQTAQITYHLNRAMDNGLTQPQMSEALAHLAFSTGWPNVFSAIPVIKDVFEKRAA